MSLLPSDNSVVAVLLLIIVVTLPRDVEYVLSLIPFELHVHCVMF